MRILKKAVPVRDYEELRPYIERVVAGEPDVSGKENPFILQKPLVPHQALNTFHFLKNRCPSMLKLPRMPCLLTFTKPVTPLLLMVR